MGHYRYYDLALIIACIYLCLDAVTFCCGYCLCYAFVLTPDDDHVVIKRRGTNPADPAGTGGKHEIHKLTEEDIKSLKRAAVFSMISLAIELIFSIILVVAIVYHWKYFILVFIIYEILYLLLKTIRLSTGAYRIHNTEATAFFFLWWCISMVLNVLFVTALILHFLELYKESK